MTTTFCFAIKMRDRKGRKRGQVFILTKIGNTFINDTECKNVIASDRRERGNLVQRECILAMISFHCRRLPRFTRNDIQKELPNY